MQNKKKQKFQQQREKIQVRETITSEDTPEVIVKETTEADVHETVKKKRNSRAIFKFCESRF